MKCQKCGGKIDPTGRYCMECFEPVKSYTAAEELGKPFPIKAVLIAGGAVLLVILALILISMRSAPPEQVVLEWLEACANGSALRATRYTTDEFENSSGIDRKMSYEKSDEYVMDRRNVGLTFTPHPPTYDPPKRPTTAEVVVTYHYGKDTDFDRTIILRKVGRDWKIDGFGQ